MKVRTIYLFSVIISLSLLIGISNQCRPVPLPVHPPDGGEISGPEKMFLWKISKGDVGSYILGSLHFMKEEFYPPDKRLEQAFTSSTVLVLETYIPSQDRAAMIMKKGVFSADEAGTLRNQIGEETYGRVKEKVKQFNMDIGFFKKFKPWYLAQTISFLDMLKKGYHPNFALDKYYLDKALKQKKEIKALENLEEQLEFYDCFSVEVNEAFLISSLEKDTDDGDGMDEIVEAWRNGDTRAMERLMEQAMNKSPYLKTLYEHLIYRRNDRMAERIATLLNSSFETYFIVIGASHLVGRRGIISQLEKRGFRLKQI